MPLQEVGLYEIVRDWLAQEPSLQEHIGVGYDASPFMGRLFYIASKHSIKWSDESPWVHILAEVDPSLNIMFYTRKADGLSLDTPIHSASAKDPQLFEKLKSGLIVAHNSIAEVTKCVLTI